MGSDDNPDKASNKIGDGTTIKIKVPEPLLEQATEEVAPPETIEFDDSTTRIMPAPAAISLPIPDPNDPGPEPTLGLYLEEEEPEQTVGIYLTPEDPQPAEAPNSALSSEQTIGVHLEEINPPAESTLDDMLDPVQMKPSETIGQHLEFIEGAPKNIHDAETLLTPDTPWQGLHPVSLAVNLLPRAWQTIRSMWPILLFVFIGGEGAGMRFIDLGVIPGTTEAEQTLVVLGKTRFVTPALWPLSASNDGLERPIELACPFTRVARLRNHRQHLVGSKATTTDGDRQ